MTTPATVEAAAAAAPDWLLRPEVGLCPCGCIGKRSKRDFVDRTIDGGARVMRQALRVDDVSARPGLLQHVDPRAKILGLLGLLLVAAVLHHAVVLLGVYVVTLVAAVASAISATFFVKRVWLFVPIFTGIVVLPATLNIVTSGDIVVPLGTWFGHEVGVTSQGLHGAAILVTRVAVSISLVVLLTLTTSWTRLLAALRSLHVPRMFILVLGMAYRYIFYLLDVVDEMYVSRKARTVHRLAAKDGRRTVAASAGALFGKSHAMAEEVHQAMTARGWNGNARALGGARIGRRDLAFLAGCIVLGGCVLAVDRALG